jgi:hypothetical protein
MIHTLDGAAPLAALLAGATLFIAAPCVAQAPSQAQRDAIKSQCRADYEAHCSGIPPGGAASLECLQKNIASLSAGCAIAVEAVEAPSESKIEPAKEQTQQETTEPKAEPAPATATAKPPQSEPKAASTPKQPTGAQISAVRSNCRADYPKVCAGVPSGGAAALQCLEKNEAQLSASCKNAVMAAGGAGAPVAAGSTATVAPAAAEPALALRPLRPREILFVMRSACGEDVRALCPRVAPGGGRIIECLVGQSAKLSPACHSVLVQFAQ